MSWLYSQALVEEYLGASCSDGEPSVQLNGKVIQQAYLLQDKMTKFSRLSRFGMTYKPLTESRGEELLTLYLEGFRAKTLVQQEKEQELKVKVQECGKKWQGSLGKFDPNTHSWKTAQCSLIEDSIEFLQTLPRSGMTVDGMLFPLPTLAQTMKGNEFGSLLATPTAHNAKEGNYPAEKRRKTPPLATLVGGKIHPHFTEWMMGWLQGWTDLKPLGTDRFQQWRQLHGDY